MRVEMWEFFFKRMWRYLSETQLNGRFDFFILQKRKQKICREIPIKNDKTGISFFHYFIDLFVCLLIYLQNYLFILKNTLTVREFSVRDRNNPNPTKSDSVQCVSCGDETYTPTTTSTPKRILSLSRHYFSPPPSNMATFSFVL